ncbi:hypothetical protein K1719_015263 [Acacia pycnantha]|nr:hypothetical protein K1719_015263 [Acacia pycnantha]
MAPPPLLCSASRNIILLSLLLFLLVPTCITASSHSQLQTKRLSGIRRMLEVGDENPPPKKKTTGQSQSLKNQTKLIKPKLTSSKNQTKTIPSNNVSSKNQTKKTIQSNTLSTAKNQTKLLKVSSSKNQTKLLKASSSKTQAKLVDTGLKKLNSTSKLKMLNSKSKPSNSTKTKTAPISSKKSLDLLPKTSDAKNKTTKPAAAIQTKFKSSDLQSSKSSKNQKASPQKLKKQTLPSWIDSDDNDDFVSDLKDLPTKFQQTLIPDLKTISTTSRAYITKANKEITKGFKPYVGIKYASTVATVLSCAFALIPLLLVSLIFNKIKAYFSIQKLLIFVQIYLSIYFSILCLSALITGLEPLKFFYSTSQSTYVGLQVLQTLGYLFYLLLLLMHLILVFSAESGMGSKFLGLAQTFLGFAIGLHYYVTVFHRVVLRQPPKTNWKIHGIYAACFLLICVFAGAERRKKAYLVDGGEEGKKS